MPKKIKGELKVKDLGKSTFLKGIKVAIPKEIYESSSLPAYGIKNVLAYLEVAENK